MYKIYIVASAIPVLTQRGLPLATRKSRVLGDWRDLGPDHERNMQDRGNAAPDYLTGLFYVCSAHCCVLMYVCTGYIRYMGWTH
jgi:hypothetical protein